MPQGKREQQAERHTHGKTEILHAVFESSGQVADEQILRLMHIEEALHVRPLAAQDLGLSQTVVEVSASYDEGPGIRCDNGKFVGRHPEVVEQQATPKRITFEVVVWRYWLRFVCVHQSCFSVDDGGHFVVFEPVCDIFRHLSQNPVCKSYNPHLAVEFQEPVSAVCDRLSLLTQVLEASVNILTKNVSNVQVDLEAERQPEGLFFVHVELSQSPEHFVFCPNPRRRLDQREELGKYPYRKADILFET